MERLHVGYMGMEQTGGSTRKMHAGILDIYLRMYSVKGSCGKRRERSASSMLQNIF